MPDAGTIHDPGQVPAGSALTGDLRIPLDAEYVRASDGGVPLGRHGEAPGVGHVGVQTRRGGHLKELHLCGRLAFMLGAGQDGSALQDTAAVLGDQAQHLLLVGAEGGFHSRSGPEQDAGHHWGFRHRASLMPPDPHGNPVSGHEPSVHATSRPRDRMTRTRAIDGVPAQLRVSRDQGKVDSRLEVVEL